MTLLTLGINHKTAPVAIRERVAFAPEDLKEALRQVCSASQLQEAAILSTCNRTEVYCSAESSDARRILAWMSEYHGLNLAELEACSYMYRDEAAVRHIMRVASGLDSMVLGEPQILGQLKTAYAVAQDAGCVGGFLDRLFQRTFSVAKRVRTETRIGENPVSVAYAAVHLAQRIFSDLYDTRALLVGAGETIELVARHLKEAGVRQMTVANRTLTRAQAVAAEFGGRAIPLTDIPKALEEVDILIASTASQLPVLGKGAVERAMKVRKHRPIFMVDLAVPRDIEEEVADLADVFLYSVDDLQQVIEENIRSRQGAAEEAEHLIEAGAAEFMHHLRSLNAVSVLRQFREQAEATRDQEVAKALKALERGNSPEQVLQAMARALTNKFLHHPSVQVRKASAEGRLEVSDWLRELHQLPPEDAGISLMKSEKLPPAESSSDDTV